MAHSRIDIGTAAGILGLVWGATYFAGDLLTNTYFANTGFSGAVKAALAIFTLSLVAISVTATFSVCGLFFAMILNDEDGEVARISAGLLKLSALIFLTITICLGMAAPPGILVEKSSSTLFGEDVGQVISAIVMYIVVSLVLWMIPGEVFSSNIEDEIVVEIGMMRLAIIVFICYSAGVLYISKCYTFEASVDSTSYSRTEVLELSVTAKGAMYVPKAGPVAIVHRFEGSGRPKNVGKILKLVDIGAGSYKAWLPLAALNPGTYAITITVEKEPAKNALGRAVERLGLDRFKEIGPISLVFHVGS